MTLPAVGSDPVAARLSLICPQVDRIALVAGLVAGVVLAGLVGWLVFRAYGSR